MIPNIAAPTGCTIRPQNTSIIMTKNISNSPSMITGSIRAFLLLKTILLNNVYLFPGQQLKMQQIPFFIDRLFLPALKPYEQDIDIRRAYSVYAGCLSKIRRFHLLKLLSGFKS